MSGRTITLVPLAENAIDVHDYGDAGGMRLAVLTVVGASIGAPATPEWGRSIAQAAPVYYVAADKLQQSQGVLMMT